MPEYTIRLAIESDLEAMYFLNTEVFPEAWSLKSFKYAWDISYDMIVCIDQNKNVIAYYLAQSVVKEKQIMQLAVSRKWRNKGVGFALMQFSVNLYPNFDFYLEVRVSNQVAISLYQKLGFQNIGVRKNYYQTCVQGEREDAWLMAYTSSSQIGQ